MKPKLITQLENKLITIFKKVNINKIIGTKGRNTAEYATDENKNITGLCIAKFDLKELPNILNYDNLSYLTHLNIYYNEIIDISPLKELENLTNLHFRYNQVQDISPLKELKNLTDLDFRNNQVQDISSLKELKNLTKLYFSRNKVQDISPLKELENLTVLDFDNNQVSDISSLKELKKIKTLDLKKNLIKILPKWICDFPEMKIQWKLDWTWDRISLYDNPIENIPIEIIKQGKDAIKNYFEQITETTQQEYMLEAKMGYPRKVGQLHGTFKVPCNFVMISSPTLRG